jgi:tetratricopeptide (TPR) repeat protein
MKKSFLKLALFATLFMTFVYTFANSQTFTNTPTYKNTTNELVVLQNALANSQFENKINQKLNEIEKKQAVLESNQNHKDLLIQQNINENNRLDNWFSYWSIFLTLLVFIGGFAGYSYKQSLDKEILEYKQKMDIFLKEHKNKVEKETTKLAKISQEIQDATAEKPPKNTIATNELEEKILDAYRLQKEDKLDGSINAWIELLSIANKNENKELQEKSYFNLGYLSVENNNYESAIGYYKKAIEINSEYDKAYNNISVAYGQLQQLDNAIKASKKAIKINPKNDDAYNNMGITYSKLKQFDKAIKCFNKSLEINSENGDVHNNTCTAYGELKQFDKAIEFCKKAIEINPKQDKAYYNIGIVYNELKQFEKAIESYKKAIEINPKKDKAYYNMGIVYGQLRQLDKSIESFNKSLEINPNNENSKKLLDILIKEKSQEKNKNNNKK